MQEITDDAELTYLTAGGFLPCGLSQTAERCPVCESLLGRFRAGLPGKKFYSPKAQQTRLSDTERSCFYCRVCGKAYQ